MFPVDAVFYESAEERSCLAKAARAKRTLEEMTAYLPGEFLKAFL